MTAVLLRPFDAFFLIEQVSNHFKNTVTDSVLTRSRSIMFGSSTRYGFTVLCTQSIGRSGDVGQCCAFRPKLAATNLSPAFSLLVKELLLKSTQVLSWNPGLCMVSIEKYDFRVAFVIQISLDRRCLDNRRRRYRTV